MEKVYIILHGYMADNKGIAEVIFASRSKNEAEAVLNKQAKTNSEFFTIYETPLDTMLTDLNHWPGLEFGKEDFD